MPWFGLQCRKAQRKYYLAKRNNLTQRNEASKRKLTKSCKKYKSTVKNYHQKYIKTLQDKIRKTRVENPKRYWKMINSIDKKHDDIPIEMNVIFDYFKELNSNNNDLEISQTSRINSDTRNSDTIDNVHILVNDETIASSSALNDFITEAEIDSTIKTLKSDKSCGCDEIVNEYITSTKHFMLPIYTSLFNIILDSGNIPSDWTRGIIIPIYKNKGSKRDPANYRPITLLSCLGKLFTSILNKRLYKYLDENNLLSETQSGFRKEYSTIDNIFALYALQEYCKSKKMKLYSCFIDFTKAFDNVWRIGLWQKLMKHGIKGKVLNVIKNMYAEIKSCILLNGDTSGYFKCEKGVRQGENLSPLLFSLYLNDLETFLLNQGCDGVNINITDQTAMMFLKLLLILYADDTILMSDDVNKFQYLLNCFTNYCLTWKLQINASKTKIMIFGSNARSNNVSFTLAGEAIENVTEFKYLGVLFTQNGRFVKYIKHLSEIACKAMYLLRKRIVNLHLPIDCQLKLFDQTIVPILLYGSEVISFEKMHLIEKIHLDFLKGILKMKKSTPHIMVYGEFGRFPLEIAAKVRMIKYWSKTLTGSDTKISRKLYNVLLNLHKNNIYSSKWILCVENILQTVGLNYIWLDNYVQNVEWLCKEVKYRLQCQFVQKWNSDVFNSSKCINYRIFKTNFVLEKYLIELSVKSYITLAKFRTTNNRLPIEKGRWDNIERNQRFCPLCNCNLIGDEFHYLFQCEFFKDSRQKLLPRYYVRNCNIYKFQKLMSTPKVKLLNNISEFVHIVLSKFK